MKNLFKSLLVLLFLFSCGDEEFNVSKETTRQNDNIQINSRVEEPIIKCQSFTIGIGGGIVIETEISYCCVGDWCVPGPTTPCYNCGFVGDSGKSEIDEINGKASNSSKKGKKFQLHISELLNSNKLETSGSIKFTVVSSSQILHKKKKYQIELGEYQTDEEGYVTLNIIKVKKNKKDE